MISERLEKLRKSKDFSKAEVARRLNLATTTYFQYEKGQREPDIEMIRRFAEFYNVSVDYLINGFEDNKLEKRINNFIEDYLSLSESEQKILETTLDLIKKK